MHNSKEGRIITTGAWETSGGLRGLHEGRVGTIP